MRQSVCTFQPSTPDWSRNMIRVSPSLWKERLRVPPGTQSGQKFRLRERGVPSLRAGGVRGDQYVEVRITLPKVISEETKELLHEYARRNPDNPRAEMGLE